MSSCIVEENFETSMGTLYHKRSSSLSGVPIVLLHGFSFTSDVWVEIGLLDRLCTKDIPFIAPDMPYGMRVSRSFRARSVERNLDALRELLSTLNITQAYLVGASLGGYTALKYNVLYDHVVGMTLIAPVNSLEDDIIDALKTNPVPIQLIYGSEDEIVDFGEMEKFSEEIRGVVLKTYEEAPHPAYLKYPERFIDDVINHYRESIRVV